MRQGGLAALAVLATLTLGAHALALKAVKGTVTEIAGSTQLLFWATEDGSPVRYYNGTEPCTQGNVPRFHPSTEALLIEAFKNGWKVSTEYKTLNSGIKCAIAIYVTK